ncbi:MAG: 5'-3' exonuclease H3TH domain-containing protein, partial [Calditrichota bacterium]
MSDRKRLFLLDGSAIFYRSYFAFIRNPLFNSRGENTSAIFGFTNTLMKILSEEKPDEIAVVFDTKEPTFRHKKYESYKATREKMPDEMAAQYPKIVELVEAFNIPVIEKTGYEADDVIGTLARQAEARGLETFMVTGDKDFMQLITPHIHMYAIRPGKETEIFDNALVEERFGMKPGQVIDYLAMMGDSSDNVPGIAGVGEKTAKELIASFGSLDNLYSRLDEVGRPALRKKIETAREIAYLSRDLVTIDTHVPLEIDFESLKAEPADGKKLLKVFEFLEFRQFIERIPEFTGDSSGAIKTIESVEQEYTLIQTKSQ